MKKLAVLLLALCLFAATAFAEEVSWADFEATINESGVSGDFATIEEAGVKLWLPEGLNAQELSDMDRESFFVAEFATDDGADLGVQYAEIAYADYLASVQEMYEDVVEMTVNGINAVCVPMADMDTIFYVYEMPDDHVLILICAPMSDDGAVETWTIIAASVQAA